MAKKEITGYVKLQIKGGQANPAPPVGPALGQRGINIMEFCKAFNDKTKSFAGKPVPVIITVYKDKKFDFIIKSPPASHFIKEAMKLKSGSKEPGRSIIGTITKQQLKDIAENLGPLRYSPYQVHCTAYTLFAKKKCNFNLAFVPFANICKVHWSGHDGGTAVRRQYVPKL